MARQVAVGGVAPVNPRRAKFVHDPCKIFSTRFGKLVPIFRADVLPGDIWKIASSTFVRSAPMVAPVMHEEVIQTYYFFVPERIIWDNAEAFHTSGQDGHDISVAPYFSTGDRLSDLSLELDWTGSLYDHFGYPVFDDPTGTGRNFRPVKSLKCSSLPIRAYWKIVEDWFRDSWIDSEISVPTTDGDDSDWLLTSANNVFFPFGKRWERDYFTSARPAPQLGVGVSLPLGRSAGLYPTLAPVVQTSSVITGSNLTISDVSLSVGFSPGLFLLSSSGPFVIPSGTAIPPVGEYFLFTFSSALVNIFVPVQSPPYPDPFQLAGQFVPSSVRGFVVSLSSSVAVVDIQVQHPTTGVWSVPLNCSNVSLSFSGSTVVSGEAVDLGGVYADLSSATAAQVNDIRFAFQLQKFFERSARAGNRYVEHLLAHWGVRSPDMRLQRAEFIGGSSSVMSISEVLQTSSTDSTTPQGNMAGHGIGGTTARTLKYRATEHGWIIGLMVILPKTVYQQGLPRMFSRFSRFDYAYPEFVNIGEQAILNKEIYADITDEEREQVFGYIGRYDEYRHAESYVSGDFRNKLDYWHLSRKFPALPVLGPDFLNSDVDAPNGLGSPNRIFASQDEDTFWIHCKHRNEVVRSLPLTHQPGFIDHN